MVARFAGPQVLGTVAYGTAFAGLFSFITGVWGTGHIKLISEGQPIEKCIATYKVLMLFTVVIFLLASIGWFSIQKYIFNGFSSSTTEIVVIISILAHILNLVIIAGETTFAARLEQYKSNFPKLINSLIYQILRIFLAVLGFGAIALAAGKIIAGILVLPIIIQLFRKFPKGEFDRKLGKIYLKYALPVLVIVIAQTVTQYSDKIFLEEFSDTTEVGYYTAAFSIGGLVLLVGNSIGRIFFPLFSKYISENNWDNVNDKICTYMEILILFLPIILMVALAANPIILTVLGENYEPSVLPFLILTICTYFMILFQPFGNVISGMGRLKIVAFIQVGQMCLFLLSMVVLVSPKIYGLGATGMAAATFTGFFFQGIMFYYFSQLIGKLKVRKKILLANCCLFIFSFIILGFFDLYSAKSITFWVILLPFFLIVCYIFLYFIGFLNSKILLLVSQILDIKKLIKYIINEQKL